MIYSIQMPHMHHITAVLKSRKIGYLVIALNVLVDQMYVCTIIMFFGIVG